MKHNSDLKVPTALPFEAGQLQDKRPTAMDDSPPRLTPESVRDFNVQNKAYSGAEGERSTRP